MARRREEAVCAICGNVDDLFAPYGVPYCRQCRFCGHEFLVRVPCTLCFCERYTVWTFLGPCIVDMEQYIEAAQYYGVPLNDLRFWRYEEEEYFQRMGPPYVPMEQEERERIATIVGLPAPRQEPIPYPLFHLSPRGPRRPR
jgi:hypothetical protein